MIYYNGSKLELRINHYGLIKREFLVIYDGIIRRITRSTYRIIKKARANKCDVFISSTTGEIKLLKIYLGKYIISFNDNEPRYLK